ncbi:PAAR domain-containing protein [Prosthecochloris sp.]|uniref:PAAR domain-containing protein n=1 Tax=Prosthecochloris sp. TaxID=290513 RepID=UPI0025CC145C|nr:PAAR domain-containing protein [Prosthecochloris sp.]
MPGVSRVGVDTAGGTIIEALAPSVFINSAYVAVLGCAVQGHGLPPHDSPVMAESSSTVFAESIGVCRQGDKASCGHPATGSGDVFAGG